jgi:hypothetical protein
MQQETPTEEIILEAERRLRAKGYHELTKLICKLKGGKLVVTGTLSSFFLMQVAQQNLLSLKVPLQMDIVVQRP